MEISHAMTLILLHNPSMYYIRSPVKSLCMKTCLIFNKKMATILSYWAEVVLHKKSTIQSENE